MALCPRSNQVNSTHLGTINTRMDNSMTYTSPDLSSTILVAGQMWERLFLSRRASRCLVATLQPGLLTPRPTLVNNMNCDDGISGCSNHKTNCESVQTWGDERNPPRLVAEAVNFACLGAKALPEANGLNNTFWKPFECVNGLRAQIHFPTCWNGVDLYKVDGSHVAHLSQIDNGVCSPSHPHQLPHIFLETLYSVDSIPGDTVRTSCLILSRPLFISCSSLLGPSSAV